MNVILISIDTLRFDCVGYQPDKRGLDRYNLTHQLETPVLDGLAEKSLCFTNCFSTNTYTTSAHASLFTGLYPQRHGVRAFYDTKLNESVQTLADVYKANGYETVMMTTNAQLFLPLDLHRGFDHIFTNDFEPLHRFLRESAGKKIFLFVHFFDVHAPYLYSRAPISEEDNTDYFVEMDRLYKKIGLKKTSEDPRKMWHVLGNYIDYAPEILFPLYIRGITWFDKGRLKTFVDELSSSGYLENGLTVIVSDHGEGTCTAGKNHFSHAGDLFDNVLRVPLIIRHPDIKHKVMDNLISIVDIYSTITGMSGVRSEEINDSLYMGEIRDKAYFETWRSSLVVLPEEQGTQKRILEGPETKFLIRQRGVRTQKAKYILQGDPGKKLDSVIERAGKNLFIHYYRYLPSYMKRAISKRILGDDNSGGIFNVPDSEFVRYLYRSIFSRFEDAEGLENYTLALKNGKITKEELLVTFLSSPEYKANPRHKVYNLEEDPFEEHPIILSSTIKGIEEFHRHYNFILELEERSVQTGSVWESAAGNDGDDEDINKEAIINELKNLGYL